MGGHVSHGCGMGWCGASAVTQLHGAYCNRLQPPRTATASSRPAPCQDLATARSLLTEQLLAVVDDTIAQMGLDPNVEALDDKTYAAVMLELQEQRG